VLLAELAVSGYVSHVGADGRGSRSIPDPPGAAPLAITRGSAVQRIGAGDSLSSRGMPAGTVALTFDDGPHPVWTPRVLAVFARYHAHATFFQVGSQVNRLLPQRITGQCGACRCSKSSTTSSCT
jgi:peptidoglycan/xylan/chitin deacetylase (PgdA/CDA1 family)